MHAAITKFFIENEIDTLSFDTPEEAQTHVDMVNKKYGDIAFVTPDAGKFTVKFKAEHLGEGFEEYKPGSQSEDMAEAA